MLSTGQINWLALSPNWASHFIVLSFPFGDGVPVQVMILPRVVAANRGQHGTAWDSMGQHGTAWDSMGQHWTAWDSMGQHGQYGTMGRHGQYGTAWDNADRCASH